MASTGRTRNGASARAGKASSKPKTAARRAPARASATPAAAKPRVATRTAAAGAKSAVRKPVAGKPAARKTAARTVSAKTTRGGIPTLPIALVAGLLALAWFLYPMARLHYTEQRKVELLQSQLASIQKRNGALKAEVDKLKTPQGVEQAARELGLARPGEQVWVTVEGGKVRAAPTTASPVRADAVSAPPWTTRLLDLIFGVGP